MAVMIPEVPREYVPLTSLKPITERSPKLYEGAIKGVPATIHFCKDLEGVQECATNLIESLKNEGITDVVFLTCDTVENSILEAKLSDGKFKKKLFTTCRKFKGLEADAVILVDVDEHTFEEENVLRYYVGASRARVRLDMITMMDDEECTRVLTDRINYSKKIKKPMRELAYALNALPSIERGEE